MHRFYRRDALNFRLCHALMRTTTSYASRLITIFGVQFFSRRAQGNQKMNRHHETKPGVAERVLDLAPP